MLDILSEAKKVVEGDRQRSYGDVVESHARIGKLWSAILRMDREIAPQEVALCMIAMKISREVSNHKDDNLVDIIGYTICLNKIISTLSSREEYDKHTEKQD